MALDENTVWIDVEDRRLPVLSRACLRAIYAATGRPPTVRP